MECKSCGSVKFKQIKPSLFECEYCGRQVESVQYKTEKELEEEYNLIFKPNIGWCVCDPTRTLMLQSVDYTDKIVGYQDKLQNLEKQNKKLKKDCLSIRKDIKRMIES